jgi:hypothetical protein
VELKRLITQWVGAGRRERLARARAIEIASKALAGQLDPLLACRELARLVPSLPTLPADVVESITQLADDTEHLPIGDERKYWAEESLVKRDVWPPTSARAPEST